MCTSRATCHCPGGPVRPQIPGPRPSPSCPQRPCGCSEGTGPALDCVYDVCVMCVHTCEWCVHKVCPCTCACLRLWACVCMHVRVSTCVCVHACVYKILFFWTLFCARFLSLLQHQSLTEYSEYSVNRIYAEASARSSLSHPTIPAPNRNHRTANSFWRRHCLTPLVPSSERRTEPRSWDRMVALCSLLVMSVHSERDGTRGLSLVLCQVLSEAWGPGVGTGASGKDFLPDTTE